MRVCYPSSFWGIFEIFWFLFWQPNTKSKHFIFGFILKTNKRIIHGFRQTLILVYRYKYRDTDSDIYRCILHLLLKVPPHGQPAARHEFTDTLKTVIDVLSWITFTLMSTSLNSR